MFGLGISRSRIRQCRCVMMMFGEAGFLRAYPVRDWEYASLVAASEPIGPQEALAMHGNEYVFYFFYLKQAAVVVGDPPPL